MARKLPPVCYEAESAVQRFRSFPALSLAVFRKTDSVISSSRRNADCALADVAERNEVFRIPGCNPQNLFIASRGSGCLHIAERQKRHAPNAELPRRFGVHFRNFPMSPSRTAEYVVSGISHVSHALLSEFRRPGSFSAAPWILLRSAAVSPGRRTGARTVPPSGAGAW